MNLQVFLMFASISTAIALPISIRMSFADKVSQSLKVKPFEKVENTLSSLKQKQTDV